MAGGVGLNIDVNNPLLQPIRSIDDLMSGDLIVRIPIGKTTGYIELFMGYDRAGQTVSEMFRTLGQSGLTRSISKWYRIYLVNQFSGCVGCDP